MTRAEKLLEIHNKLGGEENARKLGNALCILRLCTLEQLKSALEDQIKKEHYENCSLIQFVIKEKENDKEIIE